MAEENKPNAEEPHDIEAMKKKFKPKKKNTMAEDMLKNANSYDDKLLLVKVLSEKEQGRVVLMIKNMLKAK
ncbi:MAG: hypothetical protein RIR02_779 [Pseudomonadota bacterium]|jgi:diacylglycerol kinase family enzyme